MCAHKYIHIFEYVSWWTCVSMKVCIYTWISEWHVTMCIYMYVYLQVRMCIHFRQQFMDSDSDHFWSWSHHLLVMCLWEIYLTFSNLSLLSVKMNKSGLYGILKIIQVAHTEGGHMIKYSRGYKRCFYVSSFTNSAFYSLMFPSINFCFLLCIFT